jgi:diguanylate cyclase (GGDEF)-like protein
MILLLLLASATATIIGVRGLVDEVQRTEGQLRLETATVAALRSDLVDHEQAGHQLLSNAPVDRVAFVKQQREISRRFDKAVILFPARDGMRATVIKARQTWQNNLKAHGLWGDQVQALRGDHEAETPAFAASSDATGVMWDTLEFSSYEAMDQGLGQGADFERALIIALIGMFSFAVAMTVYVRGRMAKDVIRPVGKMHLGVLRIQAGDYRHRIEVTRHDELGELAVAFNEMAHALHKSHLALTLRATHDPLTGLANRAALTDRLHASFGPGSERRARHESLLFIDIDDFKDVNDSAGHEGGDTLLVELAARLNQCVRGHDLVARVGGDEFAVVVTEDDDSGSVAVEIADRIQEALRAPFNINGDQLVVTVSIGVAQRRFETVDAAELLRQADSAMYMAKGDGKARYRRFPTVMDDEMVAI